MFNPKFKNQPVVKYTQWIIDNKLKIIFLSLLSVLIFGSGGRFLAFSNDYRNFFGDTNPQLMAFEQIENTYTRSDNLVFVLTPKSKKIFSQKSLFAVQELTKRSWQIPHSTRVDSLTNFQHTTAKGDDLFVDNLVRNSISPLSPEEIANIQKIALNEPILKDLLITDKMDVTGISVSIQLPGTDPKEVNHVVNFARDLRSQFLKDFPDFEVRISGVIPLNNAFAEIGQRDATTLTPIMYLTMIFIMALLFRSFGAVISALGVIVLSTASAMGIAGYMGVALTPPSATAPTVILTLAIADSVHLLISMIILMKKGWSKTDAILESMRTNFQAIFLTSVTTIVGFICLNFSDSPPIHDLGNITSIGVFLAFLYSITFLPAMLSLLPIRVSSTSRETNRVFEKIGDFVISRWKGLLCLTATSFFILIAFIPKIDLNDQFIQWFDKRVEFRTDSEYMLEHLTGIYTLQYSIHSGEAEGISRPEFMNLVKKFSDWWQEQPEVIHVTTYTNIMKKINKSMHGDDQSWYRLPQDLDLASQYLLLYEMSLPFGLDLNNQIDINKSSIKLIVTMKELTSTQNRALSARGDQWLRKNAPSEMHANATGPSVMFSHISQRNIESMIKGTTIAIILITLLMMITLKSFKYGLISLLPNAMPALMSFGLWSILFEQVGMAVSIVTSCSLGIIVDDSVHFLTKFLRAKREENLSSSEAIRYAFSNVGLALFTTSFILIVGFGMLSYSSFLLNWSLGLLSVFTILFALVIDFFFLPSFLLLIDRKRETP